MDVVYGHPDGEVETRKGELVPFLVSVSPRMCRVGSFFSPQACFSFPCLVAAMSTFLVRTQRGLPPASSSPGLPSAPAASRALVHLPCRLYRLRRHLRRQRLSAGHRWSRIVIKRACLFRDDRARFTIKCARGSILR